MSTLSAPPDQEPFPAGEPWNLTHRDQALTVIASTLTGADRIPPSAATNSLVRRGFAPYLRDSSVDEAISTAERLIATAPTLHRIVQRRIVGIGMITSPDPAYDTSHSEPAWPGWIFVSLPPAGPIAPMRLAEGIIHEAMHHNLTAFEVVEPLVTSPDRRFYSPWKREQRAASGVLHGLYVFSCLLAYFRLYVAAVGPMTHVQNRIDDILDEIRLIDRDGLKRALTPGGQVFCTALYDLVGCR